MIRRCLVFGYCFTLLATISSCGFGTGFHSRKYLDWHAHKGNEQAVGMTIAEKNILPDLSQCANGYFVVRADYDTIEAVNESENLIPGCGDSNIQLQTEKVQANETVADKSTLSLYPDPEPNPETASVFAGLSLIGLSAVLLVCLAPFLFAFLKWLAIIFIMMGFVAPAFFVLAIIWLVAYYISLLIFPAREHNTKIVLVTVGLLVANFLALWLMYAKEVFFFGPDEKASLKAWRRRRKLFR